AKARRLPDLGRKVGGHHGAQLHDRIVALLLHAPRADHDPLAIEREIGRVDERSSVRTSSEAEIVVVVMVILSVSWLEKRLSRMPAFASLRYRLGLGQRRVAKAAVFGDLLAEPVRGHEAACLLLGG